MLLNGASLDGVRILSPTTVKLMASDHLGSRIEPVVSPGEQSGDTGYTFGLGFMVRRSPGSRACRIEGRVHVGGYAGTFSGSTRRRTSRLS